MIPNKTPFVKITAIAAAAFFLTSGGTARSNVITNFTTVFDTDVTYAGTGGLRATGSGTITVGGVSGSASLSYLYWHGPTNSSDPNANANVTVNGTGVTGTKYWILARQFLEPQQQPSLSRRYLRR
jgi:hypothetical protein